jgi:hypothetical protein
MDAAVLERAASLCATQPSGLTPLHCQRRSIRSRERTVLNAAKGALGESVPMEAWDEIGCCFVSPRPTHVELIAAG